jgi:hypothetical protein
MSPQEKALARKIFQNLVFHSDGQAFEDLFVNIMNRSHKGFKSVKPQGQHGDRKNDGYIPDLGVYYQVFAPEDIEKKTSVADACKKIVTDFTGLKRYWGTISPVREFYFVLNDKYKGTFPDIEKHLISIKNDHHLDNCTSFLAKNLEDELFALQDDEIFSIVGYVPNPDQIQTIDYSILTEVVNYILGQKQHYDLTQNLNAPDFNDKIRFNGLGPEFATLLTYHNFQVGILEEFFQLNSDFAKQELRDILRGIYQDSKAKSSNLDSDQLFLDILRAITPNQGAQYQEPALVLMSYYFEYCDIFEDPLEDGNK